MNNSGPPETTAPARTLKLSRDTVSLIGDLLPLLDFAGVLLAAYLGTLVYAGWLSPGVAPPGIIDDLGRAALAAAVLAPFILCDRAFVTFASGGQSGALIRCYAVRFVMFAGVVTAIGFASRSLAQLPGAWLALWFAGSLAITAVTRLLLIGNLRRLERQGILTESVAVAGAGPLADRLIRHLRQTLGDRIEILGVFDDRVNRSDGCVHPPTGSVADLIELGKTRSMDWILLTQPGSADIRVQALVHRLKALAVPVGLCPPTLGIALPSAVRYAGAGLPMTLLADRPHTAWDSIIATSEMVLPHWIVTLLNLPRLALRLLLGTLHKLTSQPAKRAADQTAPAAEDKKLVCTLDPFDLERFTEVAAGFGQEHFGYAVSPNADHLIRLHREPTFRECYAGASYVLLDSRFLSHVLRLTRQLQLPVCTGSDITARLFEQVIRPDDGLVLIGGSAEQAERLRQRYGLNRLAHFNPPMGFIHDPAALEACLAFVEAHSPFRYCLLAVGAPQQEQVAHRLKARGIARGLALCVGASVNFLTGAEQRAPLWMQRSGTEWLYRLVQAPGRMAGRYLVRGPQIFGLLRRTEFVLRPAPDSPSTPTVSIAIGIARDSTSTFSGKLIIAPILTTMTISSPPSATASSITPAVAPAAAYTAPLSQLGEHRV